MSGGGGGGIRSEPEWTLVCWAPYLYPSISALGGVCGNADHPGRVWWYLDRGEMWKWGLSPGSHCMGLIG